MKENKTKSITFRLSKEEYKRLLNEKPFYETVSQYVRRVLLYTG